MRDLNTVTHKTFGTIRYAKGNGKAFFLGKDIATILGYIDHNSAIRNRVWSIYKVIVNLTDENNVVRPYSMISYNGILLLAGGSRLTTAAKINFIKWIESLIED